METSMDAYEEMLERHENEMAIYQEDVIDLVVRRLENDGSWDADTYGLDDRAITPRSPREILRGYRESDTPLAILVFGEPEA